MQVVVKNLSCRRSATLHVKPGNPLLPFQLDRLLNLCADGAPLCPDCKLSGVRSLPLPGVSEEERSWHGSRLHMALVKAWQDMMRLNIAWGKALDNLSKVLLLAGDKCLAAETAKGASDAAFAALKVAEVRHGSLVVLAAAAD